ncbi:uncharacterized protein LOC129769763 [Toxorhynchites rutilus septentrionalis]|uniref:uncharacterized protein LOC129769763 n=1 Tax=Toxorhynchites rutilus septentrionalis TaxID=329112 RepID=UPI00247A11CC|nr:uncharacterized protein LOC129769763 [Toxorhynchites rutilus septentrionalis]
MIYRVLTFLTIACGAIADVPISFPYKILLHTTPSSGFISNPSTGSFTGAANTILPYTSLNVLFDPNFIEQLRQTLLERGSGGATSGTFTRGNDVASPTLPVSVNHHTGLNSVSKARLLDSNNRNLAEGFSGSTILNSAVHSAGINNGFDAESPSKNNGFSVANSNGLRFIPVAYINGNILSTNSEVRGASTIVKDSTSYGTQSSSVDHPGYPRVRPSDNIDSIGYSRGSPHPNSVNSEIGLKSDHGSSTFRRIIFPQSGSDETKNNIGTNQVLSSNLGGKINGVNNGGPIGITPLLQSATLRESVDTDLITNVLRMIQVYDSRLVTTPIAKP